MYNLLLYGGSESGPVPNATQLVLQWDGIFIDNCFLTDGAAVNARDIHGRPFYPDPNGTGRPMNRSEFNTLWYNGVAAELDTLRQLMPHTLLCGHAMDPADPVIQRSFNGISIGFTMPKVVEGRETFAAAWQQYKTWFDMPLSPQLTMVEGAIPLQIGCRMGRFAARSAARTRAGIGSPGSR